MPAPLTRAYAEFAAGLRGASLPDGAADIVRLGFTDCAGVMLAGRREPVVRKLIDYARAVGAHATARIGFTAERLGMAQAGLINATAAHALDFDDYAFSNHPSAVLVPTLMAAAEAAGADGAAMLRGYVAGYEIWADLMLREPDHFYPVGWHPTAVLGPVGAAGAASVVLGLDAERTRHALALAASLAGGVFENFGTMAKPMHGGRAAEAGLIAALLARQGIEASPAALESETGMMRAFSPHRRTDRESRPPLGEVWRILKMRVNIKKFPTVGASQRGIDAALALRALHAPAPAEIAAIEVHIGDKHQAVMPFHAPRTALEAKFSAEFAIACALLQGGVGLMQLQDELVQSAEMQRMMALVRPVVTTDFDPDYPNAAPFDLVRVTLKNGTVLESPQVRRATGHADVPLPVADLRAKFDDCAAYGGVAPGQADALFAAMRRIDSLASVAEIPLIDAA